MYYCKISEGKQWVHLCFTFCDHIHSFVQLYVTGNNISVWTRSSYKCYPLLGDFLSADAIKWETSWLSEHPVDYFNFLACSVSHTTFSCISSTLVKCMPLRSGTQSKGTSWWWTACAGAILWRPPRLFVWVGACSLPRGCPVKSCHQEPPAVL